MKRKTILVIAVILATLAALLYCWNTFGRLLVIRATMGTGLPEWAKAIIWGW